jgi:branched-subunit amino acid permease
MTVDFDWLVYVSLAALVFVVVVAAVFIFKQEKEQPDIEVRKIRFAAATFTGIMFLFVFISSLYFVGSMKKAAESKESQKAECCCKEPSNPGKEIFEKGLTSMFTLAGTIAGYLFGTGSSRRRKDDELPSPLAGESKANV